MGRHVPRFVAEEELAVLEADAGDPQSVTVRVLEIMHANRPETRRAWAPELLLVACRGAPPCGLPA